jgi:voltage-gated potassium channel
MATMKIQRIIGLAGVPINEATRAQTWGTFFEWYLLCIAFWLPVEWYLVIAHAISPLMLHISDWFVWSSFFTETVVMAFLVRQKLYYLRGNWLNLVIIIVVFPIWFAHFPGLAAIRLVRLLILFRVIVPWVRSAHDTLSLNRLGATLLVFFVVTCLSGILVSALNVGIANPFQGIWWAWETVTTVGYGDVIPSGVLGKVIAMLVMLMGIGLFSLVTANMSAYFIGGKDRSKEVLALLRQNEKHMLVLEKRLEDVDARLGIDSKEKLFDYVEKLTPAERKRLLQRLQQESTKISGL